MLLFRLMPVLVLSMLTSTLARSQATPAGDWRGMSICQVKPSACNDEDSLYHFRAVANRTDAYELQADKIVDGKPVTMGLLRCSYNASRQLSCPLEGNRATLLFELNGDLMQGTMTLADGTLWRKLTLRRRAPSQD
jgi:hypothetical protein